MNKAKNDFVKWLKDNNATDIDGANDNPTDNEWDYYLMVSGFIENDLYTACFMVWHGKESIDYSDEENRYSRISIYEFMQLIS